MKIINIFNKVDRIIAISHIPFLVGIMLLSLLGGCIFGPIPADQTYFSVASGGERQPVAKVVFSDADKFVRARGYVKRNEQIRSDYREVMYFANDIFLSVKTYEGSSRVHFSLVADANAYNRRSIQQFASDYKRTFSGKYGAENIHFDG